MAHAQPRTGPSRRQFLAGAAALAAAPALGRRAAPFRKAAGLGMVEGARDLREAFQMLRDSGFEGVELDAPNGYALDQVLRARDDSGLLIHGVVDSQHWSKPFNHPDPAVRAAGVEALEQAVSAAHDYGAGTVLVVPAVVGKDMPYAQAWELSQAEIRKVLPLAAEKQVQLAVEEVWNQFLMSPLEFARYVDAFDSPAVRAYFDVGNVIDWGWPEQWIQVLGARIARVHVKEFSRRKRDQEGLWKGFEVELLEGDNDWPAVMAAFRAAGVGGWMTAEVGGGGRTRLAEVAARMDRILAL